MKLKELDLRWWNFRQRCRWKRKSILEPGQCRSQKLRPENPICVLPPQVNKAPGTAVMPTLKGVVPGSRPASVLLSTMRATRGSPTRMKSLTRSVTSTSQSGPSMVTTWSVPSDDVVWN